MRRASLIAGIAVVIVVALSFVTGSSAAKRTAAAVHTAPVTAATVVCPAVNAQPAGSTASVAFADVGRALQPPRTAAGSVVLSTLAGARTTTATLHPAPVVARSVKTGTSSALSAAATGPVAASLVGDELIETASAGRFRGLLGASCLAPATNWWFAGADGRVGYTDSLILANPAPTPAEVAVTLWTGKGPQSPPRLEAIPVPARSRVAIGIASVAPDIPTIAMHVHADSGAIVAALIDRRSSALNSNGGDFIPPTAPPSRTFLVPGFPAGGGPRRLVLADPGQVDATVDLKLVTRSGTFAPAGANQVVVHQQHTAVIDLTKVFGGSPGAVKISSDQPVVAQGLAQLTATGLRPDLMWTAAVPPLAGPAGVANGHEPDGGGCALVLTAPAGTAKVTVATPAGRHSVITVPAGRSVSVLLTNLINAGAGPWPFTVTPSGNAPVYAVRVLFFSGAHGALITGEPLSSLPRPIPLPPVRDDQRVAVR